jgi:hypothetical protein
LLKERVRARWEENELRCEEVGGTSGEGSSGLGGRQAVRPRTLDPVSKVRILPAQPVFVQMSR